MKKLDRHTRKSYAMRRMTLAIERAIKRPTSKEKERAARWAAVWGLLCGIQTEGVNLKASDIQSLERRIDQASDSTIVLDSSPSSGGGIIPLQLLPSVDTPSSVPFAPHASPEPIAHQSA